MVRVQELAERVTEDVSPELLMERLQATLALVAAVPPDHPDRPSALLLLAEAEFDRWQFGGETEGAMRAYLVAQDASAITTPDHPLRLGVLSLLATAAAEAARHGSSETLTTIAVAAAREALDLAGTDAERARHLDGLGNALVSDAEVNDDNASLREAVRHQREAVALSQPESEGYPLRLSHLSRTLVRIGQTDDDIALLGEAVEASRLAVVSIASTDPRRVGLLYNYATNVAVQARQARTPAPLIEAELAYRAGLALLPPGHPDHPRFRSAIAATLSQQHTIGGDVDALVSAVTLAREAVAETEHDHHWWPVRALLLADSAAELAGLGGPEADLLHQEADALYTEIAASPVSPPPTRRKAEHKRLALIQQAGDPFATLAAVERILAAIPPTIGRTLPGRRRLDAVRRLGGLATDAIAAGVAARDPEWALELVERGRSLLFNEAWGIRRAWIALNSVAPDVATELEFIEDKLAKADVFSHVEGFTIEVSSSLSPDTTAVEWNPRPHVADTTRQLAERRDELFEYIRALPGMEGFLQPRSISDIRRQAAGVPIVVVASHSRGGHALLIPADPAGRVAPVALPALRDDTVRSLIEKQQHAVAIAHDSTQSLEARESAQDELHEVLVWLWDNLAAPVLDQVAPIGPPRPKPTRLLWCPVGRVTHLPVHAAGHHREPEPRRAAVTVYDRVISSYTPSMSAATEATSDPRPDTNPGSALCVGVAVTPGAPALLQAHSEAEYVARMIPGSTVVLDEDADLDTVERELRAHSIAHFACHAESDLSLSAPLAGGLRLGSGQVLRPAYVNSMLLEHAELAFLSACGSAEPHQQFPDEASHIASAFQLAGFRGVVGTLWHTPDSSRVASGMYAMLTADGTSPIDTAASATVLNDTLRRVRDEYPAVPTRWAGYVHVGR